MNLIVLNTLTTAVTEHDIGVHAMSANFFADETALYSRGGDTDNGTQIDAKIDTGCTDWGDSRFKLLECAYFSTVGSGSAFFNVRTQLGTIYSYNFALRDSGESHSKVGRGLRENRYAFGFANIGGADFRLDGMEVLIAQSSTRRT